MGKSTKKKDIKKEEINTIKKFPSKEHLPKFK
jgi:hypothetical protein